MASAALPGHVFGPTKAEVPKVGLGTWYLEQSEPQKAIAAVQMAVDLGLTHIDTAELYGSAHLLFQIRRKIWHSWNALQPYCARM